MARKHSKRGTVKQDVVRELIEPERSERKVAPNPETGDYEVQRVVTSAVWKQGRAQGPTTKRGQRNGSVSK